MIATWKRLQARARPVTRALGDRGLDLLSLLHQAGVDEDIRWTRQFAARLARVLLLAGMSFATNQIPVRASALTYTTILFLTPFAILLSAVAAGFGYLDLLSRLVPYLNESLNLNLPLDMILGVIENAQRMDFHKLGLLGSVGLLFAFFLSMSNIELAIDHIWDIRKERNWWRQLREFTPFLLLLIGLIVAAGNLLLKYRDFLSTKASGEMVPQLVHGTVFLLGSLGVVLFIWLALILLFYIIPNTRVRLLPAMLGATVATGAIYLLSRLLVFFPTLLLTKNNYVFGSLAVVPALLLLLYFFWMIVLYGAAVAFIHQRLYHSREKTSAQHPQASAAFHRMEREVLDLLKAAYAVSGSPAVKGRKGVPAEILARRLGMVVGSVEVLATPLIELGLLARKRVSQGPVYAPRKPISEVDLTAIHNRLLRLDPHGTGQLRSMTALDEIKHTLAVLYSSGKLNPPLYLSDVLADRADPGRRP